MNNYLQPYYQDPKIRKQHTKNAEIYNTLTSITNKKEQQFFAYFLTHIQTLQELYKTLTILRDIDETLCHRLKPEDDRHYDVIRPGIKTLMSYLKQEQETITNGILSVR